MMECLVGGVAGGVTGICCWAPGAGPGEQYGICLFGIGPELCLDVSMVRAGA